MLHPLGVSFQYETGYVPRSDEIDRSFSGPPVELVLAESVLYWHAIGMHLIDI